MIIIGFLPHPDVDASKPFNAGTTKP